MVNTISSNTTQPNNIQYGMYTIVPLLHLNWPFDNDSDTVNFGVGAPKCLKLFSKVVCKTCKWQTSCLECWQFVTSATSIVWDCYHCVSIVRRETLTRHLKAGCAGKCQNNNHIRHKLFYYFSHRFCPEFFNTFDFFSRCHTKYWIFGAPDECCFTIWRWHERERERWWRRFICWQRPPSRPPVDIKQYVVLCRDTQSPVLLPSQSSSSTPVLAYTQPSLSD